MDDIIQENLPNHALDAQRNVATRFRNLGIGIMGVQDMLIKLGHTYGSDLSVKCLDMLMRDIATDILLASAKLAEIRGAYPEYSEKVFESKFFKNLKLNDTNLAFVKKVGLRNSTLLSIAPTGLMIGSV